MIQQNHFRQWILLLEIFQLLATSNESEVLNIPPIEHNYNLKDQQRIKKIYRFVEEHYHEKVDVQEVVSLCNLSMPAFCRYFKRMTNMTFTEFLNQYRVNQAKKLLLKNYNISEACYQSGFTNLSYFNKTFNRYAQENPMHFKKRHVHAHN
jgi:AraC-like DNA-binding protein